MDSPTGIDMLMDSPSRSPRKLTVSPSFQHDYLRSPNKHLSGYTGHVRLEDGYYPPEKKVVEKSAVIGYGGWYKGKTGGKLGRSALHRGPLSAGERDNGAVEYEESDAKGFQEEGRRFLTSSNGSAFGSRSGLTSPGRAMRNTSFSAAQQGVTADGPIMYEFEIQRDNAAREKIIHEIREKFAFKFPNHATARFRVKNAFVRATDANVDSLSPRRYGESKEECFVTLSPSSPAAAGYCTQEQFEAGLNQLGICLVIQDLLIVSDFFRDADTGLVGYSRFLKEILPKLKYI